MAGGRKVELVSTGKGREVATEGWTKQGGFRRLGGGGGEGSVEMNKQGRKSLGVRNLEVRNTVEIKERFLSRDCKSPRN